MLILFSVLFVCVIALLWVVFLIARLVRRHRAERRITQDFVHHEYIEPVESARQQDSTLRKE
jgi:hypothetical protein